MTCYHVLYANQYVYVNVRVLTRICTTTNCIVTTHWQKKLYDRPLHEWPLCSQTLKRTERPLFSGPWSHSCRRL